jgi:hypothetical protein
VNEEKETGKSEARKTRKVEVWHETVGTERITVVKTAETTTRISRKKFHDALEKIIRDPATRARLEANPVDAMAEMGIELDNKEKAAIAGRRLSEVLAVLGKSERGALGFFPESIVEVVLGTISSGPETVTATVSGTASEFTALAGTETAAEEVVVVLVVAA